MVIFNCISNQIWGNCNHDLIVGCWSQLLTMQVNAKCFTRSKLLFCASSAPVEGIIGQAGKILWAAEATTGFVDYMQNLSNLVWCMCVYLIIESDKFVLYKIVFQQCSLLSFAFLKMVSCDEPSPLQLRVSDFPTTNWLQVLLCIYQYITLAAIVKRWKKMSRWVHL